MHSPGVISSSHVMEMRRARVRDGKSGDNSLYLLEISLIFAFIAAAHILRAYALVCRSTYTRGYVSVDLYCAMSVQREHDEITALSFIRALQERGTEGRTIRIVKERVSSLAIDDVRINSYY